MTLVRHFAPAKCLTSVMHAVTSVFSIICPNIDWQSHSQATGEIGSAFVDFTTGNGYVQCVMDAVRGSNILDLVFCNDPILILQVSDPTNVNKVTYSDGAKRKVSK